MGNTFTSLHYHFVFSTKHRDPWINADIEQRVWAFLGGIARENNLKPKLIGGMPDHIHMAVGAPATLTISDALKQIKGGSSKWMKDTFPNMSKFAWQDGYGAFSVSKSAMPRLTKYIESQRKHHRKKSFQEEFVSLLDKHEIEYEERYLWD